MKYEIICGVRGHKKLHYTIEKETEEEAKKEAIRRSILLYNRVAENGSDPAIPTKEEFMKAVFDRAHPKLSRLYIFDLYAEKKWIAFLTRNIVFKVQQI